MLGNGTKTVFINTLALRPSKMRRENDARALIDRVLNGWKRGGYARVVINLPVFNGNVEIDAHKHALATKR